MSTTTMGASSEIAARDAEIERLKGDIDLNEKIIENYRKEEGALREQLKAAQARPLGEFACGHPTCRHCMGSGSASSAKAEPINYCKHGNRIREGWQCGECYCEASAKEGE